MVRISGCTCTNMAVREFLMQDQERSKNFLVGGDEILADWHSSMFCEIEFEMLRYDVAYTSNLSNYILLHQWRAEGVRRCGHPAWGHPTTQFSFLKIR